MYSVSDVMFVDQLQSDVGDDVGEHGPGWSVQRARLGVVSDVWIFARDFQTS
jgi:hypothetical protein